MNLITRIRKISECVKEAGLEKTLKNITKGNYPYRNIELFDVIIPLFLKPEFWLMEEDSEDIL